ncbi:MAG: hypothetical protein JXB14_03500 [Candidatus Altiarchaeota archaeon]|nr:hypothetical protein [Candidatus Altiarchaeota archaeon]
MRNFKCCPNGKWERLKDLGHADSFDFILDKCSVCGKYWASIFCTPTAVLGYEEVRKHDAEELISLDGKQLKKAISDWMYENL